MNWTGGRLQRHSKANANTQVKAQRDYFARARLRQNTKSSAPTLLHFSNTAADHQDQSRPSLDLPDQNPAIDEGRSQIHRRRSKAFENATHKIPATGSPSTQRRRAKVRSSHGITPPRVNTLEHVKRSLLKQSDWLGLAGTRPPKPDQGLAAASEQVGRRRRVTREDRYRQKHGAGQRKIEHNFIKPFAEVDDASVLLPTRSANLSIRIGSDIHQSQPTRSQRPVDEPVSTVPESSSTEPMLLDIVEAPHFLALQELGDYYLAESGDTDDPTAELSNGQKIPDQVDLIPLGDVRNFPSFDEVKRYSSSARHVATSSSRSASNQLIRGAIGSYTRPVQHTSICSVHGNPVGDQGLLSLDGNNHSLVNIGSEPPVRAKHPEDATMQDICADAAVADTSSTGQEAWELRSLDTASIASRKSLAAFKNSSHGGSSLANAFIDAKSNDDLRDAPHGNTSSTGYPRPPYTIKQQVQLEELRNKQQSKHLALSFNSRSNIHIGSNPQNFRQQRRHGRKSANQRPGSRARYFTTEARECSDQNDRGQSPHAQSSSDGSGHRGQGDETEAWMRDVFSTDFEKLQQRFSFAKAFARRTTYQTPPRNMAFGEQRIEIANRPHHPKGRQQSSQYSSESSLPKTIKSGINTILNVPNDLERDCQRNVFIPSETDFLTQTSPMTGYLDDRIVNLSTYNNAANTVPEFIETQHAAPKRKAYDAFGHSSYDQYDTNSQSEGKAAQISSPTPHRVPLQTLYQAPVRTHSIARSQANHEHPENMSRPVRRPAKAFSMVKNSNDKSLMSVEQTEKPSRTYNQHSRLSLEYMPVMVSAGQLRNGAQVEPSRQTLLKATSEFTPQALSPTHSSGHRVPLGSTKDLDLGHYEHQSLTNLATSRNPIPSARLGTSTSSHSAGLLPTSSRSRVCVRNTPGPVGNFHTNQAQQFVLKRPQRPPARYAHPSRAAPQFRTPPSVPLPLH